MRIAMRFSGGGSGQVGVRRKSAGRIVRLVEIDDHVPVLRHGGIEEAAGGVRFFAGGLVAEDVEQFGGVGRFENRAQRELTPLQLENCGIRGYRPARSGR